MRSQGRGDYYKRDDYDRQFHSGGGSVTLIGKPVATMTAGAQTAGTEVNLWQGPWVTGDAATGSAIEVAYATGDFATTDYVILTLINGKWIVSCFPDGSA